MHPPPPLPANQPPEGLDAIHGARILLAEDNEINQQIAVELLEKAGMVVDVAGNLGADDLSRAAGHVEKVLTAGQSDVTELLAALNQHLAVVRQSLNQMLPTPPAEPAAGPSRPPAQPLDRRAAAVLAREIATAITEDLTQATEAMEKLLALPLVAGELASARKAATYLDDFDTDEARAELEGLANTLDSDSEEN